MSEVETVTSSNSLWSDSLRRLKKNRASVYSFYFIVSVVCIGFLAPWLAPFPFDEQNVDRLLQAPSGVNWLGTDGLGRDLFSRILYGARVSMSVAILSSSLS